jgi:hypothetical protein
MYYKHIFETFYKGTGTSDGKFIKVWHLNKKKARKNLAVVC